MSDIFPSAGVSRRGTISPGRAGVGRGSAYERWLWANRPQPITWLPTPLVWMDLSQPYSREQGRQPLMRVRTSAAGSAEQDFSLWDRVGGVADAWVGAGNDGFLRSVYLPFGGPLGQATAGNQPQVFENGQWLGGMRCAGTSCGPEFATGINIGLSDFWGFAQIAFSAVVSAGYGRTHTNPTKNSVVFPRTSSAGAIGILMLDNAGTSTGFLPTGITITPGVCNTVVNADRDGNLTVYYRNGAGLQSGSISIAASSAIDIGFENTGVGTIRNINTADSFTTSRFGLGLGLLTQPQIDQLLALPFPV